MSVFSFSQSKDKSEESDLSSGVILTGLWSRSLSFIIQLIIFIAAYNEKFFKSPCVKITIACLVLFCMVLAEMATSFYR